MEIKLATADGIALYTLAAPQRRNALTVEMAHDLMAVLDEVDADPSIAATVLAAEGKGFCAGADLSALGDAGKDPLSDANYSGIGAIYSSFARFGAMKTPTIAAVRGAAVGAGLNLALAADLRIVATDARLMSGFNRIGIHPGGGHFHLLDRVVGRDTLTAMAIFGEEVSGVDAVRLGLAWRAVPEAELEATAMELAARVTRYPDLAREAVKTMRAETTGAGMSWEAAIQFERAPQMRSFWQRAQPAD